MGSPNCPQLANKIVDLRTKETQAEVTDCDIERTIVDTAAGGLSGSAVCSVISRSQRFRNLVFGSDPLRKAVDQYAKHCAGIEATPVLTDAAVAKR